MKITHWPSQWIFILAAVGSAAGLGNIWRFPFLAFEHGGASFVFAFIIANILIGIPLLTLEVALGQKTQKGAPDAFGSIKKGFRYIGWIATILGFMVVFYYMAVVAWSLNFFNAAFTLGWGEDTKSFFFENVLQLSDGVANLGGISWPVFAGLLISWVLVYFSAWKGVHSISKVVVWTATLPFVILGILIVRAITLDGAGEGLKLLFVPDFSVMGDPQLWLAAFSQVFFSLSLAFGIMVAYGAMKQRETEIAKSAMWIAAGNFAVSIMSGIVVFGMLGYMANQQGVPISEVVAGGPSLVFVVFPAIINLLPGLNALIAVLFFGALLTLAIDSAFSLLEAFAKAFRDRFTHVSTEKVTFVLAIVGILGGIIYTTQGGLYVLDIADHFIVSYGLVIIGILEAIIIGWLWKGDTLKDFVEQHSDIKLGNYWDMTIKFVIPVFLTGLLIWNIYTEFKTPYEGYPAWALFYIGVLPLLLTPLIAIALDKLTTRK